MNCFSKGARVKFVRQSLNISIEDLSSEKYKKDFMEEIEKNNEVLTHEVISYIVTRFNEKNIENNINSVFSAKYFLNNEKNIAEIRFHIYMELIRNNLKILPPSIVFKVLYWCFILSEKYNLNSLGDIFFLKASKYRNNSNLKCAQSYFRQSLNYFKFDNNINMHVKVCLILGNISLEKEEYVLAQYHYEQAHFSSSQSQDKPSMYKILYNLALISNTLKDNHKSLFFLKLIEDNYSDKRAFNYYILKVNVLFEIGNINEALNLIKKFEIKKLDNDKKSLLYNNLAMFLIEKNKYKLALKYALKSLALKKKTLKDPSTILNYYYDTVSLAYFHQRKYKQSIKYSNMALSVASSNIDIIDSCMLLAKCYIELEQYTEAERNLDRIINISTVQEYFDKLSESYSILSKLHYKLGNFHQAEIFSKSSLKWQANIIAN